MNQEEEIEKKVSNLYTVDEMIAALAKAGRPMSKPNLTWMKKRAGLIFSRDFFYAEDATMRFRESALKKILAMRDKRLTVNA
jgi:hypothetical protein